MSQEFFNRHAGLRRPSLGHRHHSSVSSFESRVSSSANISLPGLPPALRSKSIMSVQASIDEDGIFLSDPLKAYIRGLRAEMETGDEKPSVCTYLDTLRLRDSPNCEEPIVASRINQPEELIRWIEVEADAEAEAGGESGTTNGHSGEFWRSRRISRSGNSEGSLNDFQLTDLSHNSYSFVKFLPEERTQADGRKLRKAVLRRNKRIFSTHDNIITETVPLV